MRSRTEPVTDDRKAPQSRNEVGEPATKTPEETVVRLTEKVDQNHGGANRERIRAQISKEKARALMNGPMAAYAGRSKRQAAVSASARLVLLARQLNEVRAPDHRERISQAVAVTQEYFRLRPDSALP